MNEQPLSAKDVVKSVYEEITKSSDIIAKPSMSSKEKAEQILNGLL